jgi:hypothetical protein
MIKCVAQILTTVPVRYKFPLLTRDGTGLLHDVNREMLKVLT